jgi:hypothetical protein
MTDVELLSECKIGLSIDPNSTAFDGLLTQKLSAIKSFMKNAGVSGAKMDDELAVGVIVMGVADLWQIQGGETRFSPAFYTLLNQLTYDDVITP